jgi:hypothetical protein
VRQARITLIGAGPVVDALLAVGLWSGWRDVRMLTPAAQFAGLRQVTVGARRDPKQAVRLRSWPDRNGGNGREWPVVAADGADVVLQVCGAARRAELIDELAQGAPAQAAELLERRHRSGSARPLRGPARTALLRRRAEPPAHRCRRGR